MHKDLPVLTYARWCAERPWVVMASMLGVMLFLTIVPMAATGISVFGADTNGRFDAVHTAAVRRSDAVVELTRADDDEVTPLNRDAPRSVGSFFLSVIYVAESDETNIFSAESLRAIRTYEKTIMEIPEYSQYCQVDEAGECVPPEKTIVAHVFDEAGELRPDYAEIIAALSLEDDYYFDDEYDPAVGRGEVTRSQFKFGAPLPGYESSRVDMDDQLDDFRSKFLDDSGLYSLLKDGMEGDHDIDVVYTGSGLEELEIVELVAKDFALAYTSVVLVIMVLIVHTWSFWLAATGMFHIIMSFTSAAFLYSVVFQVATFPALNVMSLFVVLGIGADDIFVYIDAWKQADLMDHEFVGTMEKRVSWTLRRASKAMFVTTLTTFMAFVATAVNPIPALSVFGIYAACVVALNYLFVITWFPACVVVWHRYHWDKNCLCARQDGDSCNVLRFGLQDLEKQLNTNSVFDEKTGDVADLSSLRLMERFFYRDVSPFVHKYAKVLLVCFTVLFILNAVATSFLKQPDELESGLPSDTNLGKVIIYQTEVLRLSQGAQVHQARFVLGVEGPYINRGRDLNDMSDFGSPTFDDEWDISHPAAQQWVADMCTEVPTLVGAETEQKLVLENGTSCFMLGFQEWTERRGDTFPVAQERFLPQLYAFLNDETEAGAGAIEGGTRYRYETDWVHMREQERVGEPMRLRWALLTFNMTMDLDAGVPEMRRFNSDWSDAKDDYKERTVSSNAALGAVPDEARTMYQTSLAWPWMRTADLVVQSAIVTIIVSLVLAFLVLNITTRNLFLSVYALTTIMLIVLQLLSFVVLLGFDFGFIVSVLAIICVGLAVDFTVHLGNAYVSCPLKTDDRFAKVRFALVEMGISVSGGALTTALATVVLFGTILDFFSKFGTFVFVAIVSSWVYSIFAFCAALMLFGPVGEQGSWEVYLAPQIAWVKAKYAEFKGGDDEEKEEGEKKEGKKDGEEEEEKEEEKGDSGAEMEMVPVQSMPSDES